MRKETVDITELGEDWVNVALDFSSALKEVPNDRPHSVFYSWAVEGDDGEFVTSSCASFNAPVGFMCGIQSMLLEDSRLAPLLAASLSSFIQRQPADKRAELRDYLISVLSNEQLVIK